MNMKNKFFILGIILLIAAAVLYFIFGIAFILPPFSQAPHFSYSNYLFAAIILIF